MTINISWCDVEGAPFRFFLADAFGALSLISLDNVKESGILLIPLGIVSLYEFNVRKRSDHLYLQTSPAQSLTYLTNQALYIGSHLGDSQLITISSIPSKAEDQPTLSIPFGIQTHDRTAIATRVSKKGKQRADEEMDVDSPDHDGLSEGCIITPDGSYVKVVQSFKNIGPIIDAVMVDVEGSGQVSCRDSPSYWLAPYIALSSNNW